MRFIKNKKNLFLVLLIIIIGIGYFSYRNLLSKKEDNIFMVKKVEKGEIKKSVSGSGNIVAVNSFKIISKKGGQIIYLPFDDGDYVKKGDLLLELDSRDIERQIRDYNLTLSSYQNNLEKIKLNKSNLENNLRKIENEYNNLQRADDLKKEYKKSLVVLNNFYSEIPSIIRNVENIYFSKNLNSQNYSSNIEYYLSYFNSNYNEESFRLKDKNDQLKNQLQLLSAEFSKIRLKDNSQLNFDFLNRTYRFASDNQNFIKYGLDLIRKINEDISLKDSIHLYGEVINSHFNSLKNYYDILNNYNQSFLDILNKVNVQSDKLKQMFIDIDNAKTNIAQAENEIKNLEITIDQTKAKIDDLKEDLVDYKIYSPVNGVIDGLNFKKGDVISNGLTIMNIFSHDKVAEVKINEVDMVDIKIGQPVILTFDALPNLEIQGKISHIDPIAEIDQGVVSYLVKIILLNDNQSIKIGMTVNAEIITDSKKDILVVPNSAIKSFDNKKFIEVVSKNDIKNINKKNKVFLRNKENNNITVRLSYPPEKKFVKVGISDDLNTEIIDGLTENDWVVIRKPTSNFQDYQEQQGLFQRLLPNPRRMIRSPGVK